MNFYKVLIAQLLLVSAIAVQAQNINKERWTINSVGVAAIFESDSFEKLAAVIKCNDIPTLLLYDAVNYTEENLGLQISIKLRVDRENIFTASGTLIKDGELVVLKVDAEDQLFREMINGNFLRVVYYSVRESTYGGQEKYSLKDFTETVRKSKDFCAEREPEEFFPDDGDFFNER